MHMVQAGASLAFRTGRVRYDLSQADLKSEAIHVVAAAGKLTSSASFPHEYAVTTCSSVGALSVASHCTARVAMSCVLCELHRSCRLGDCSLPSVEEAGGKPLPRMELRKLRVVCKVAFNFQLGLQARLRLFQAAFRLLSYACWSTLHENTSSPLEGKHKRNRPSWRHTCPSGLCASISPKPASRCISPIPIGTARDAGASLLT